MKKFKGAIDHILKYLVLNSLPNCVVHDLFTHLLQNKSDNMHV